MQKTPENEAFDDLARNQGAWGGGYQAKRQMASDKLQEPDEALTLEALKYAASKGYGRIVRENSAPFTIKEALARPAQEPVSFPCCGYTDANAIRWNQFNGVVQCHMCGQVYTVAQPAQEPVQEPHEYDWSMLEAAKESLREHMARIKELEAALAQQAQPKQEPVMHIRAHDLEVLQSYSEQCHSVLYRKPAKTRIPLYTAPPQRTWVGLTDEEIDYQTKKDDHGAYFALGALWAGAKLKERNHGT